MRPQIASDVKGAPARGVKIERKLFSGKGLGVPIISTTSSFRFGRWNGSRFSRVFVGSYHVSNPVSFFEGIRLGEDPTQIAKESVISEGVREMTANTSRNSKPVHVLMCKPVRLGRRATVVSRMSTVSWGDPWRSLSSKFGGTIAHLHRT